ncbi:MAG: hypothetical protein U1D64_01500 [Bacteroidales bacterium]|nr:hypothetical protein [Bacteroidales bacterium]
MKTKNYLLILLLIVISGCGPMILPSDRGEREGSVYRRGYDVREDPRSSRGYDNNRNTHNKKAATGYIIFVKDNSRFDRVTVVIDDRTRFNMSHDYRARYPRVKEIKVKPGRHNVKIFFKGRLIQQRNITITPNREVRISL